MLALVDTCIWSLALRRQSKALSETETLLRNELRELIEEGRARLAGPIRQEILSGVRETAQYERLRQHLRAFPDEPIVLADYELAAKFSNQCRTSGIAGSSVDFLICAIAANRKWAIFTSDNDFAAYRQTLGVALHVPRN